MNRYWRDYNYFLVGCVIVLTGFSLALVYSATMRDPATQGYLSRHIINLSVGTAAMVALTVLDYHALLSWARVLYIATIGVLAAVLAIGQVRGGAQGWLDFGLRTFQPAEPAKLMLIIALAAYWQRFEGRGGETRVQLGGLLLAGVPLALVFLEPDFGTAMVIATIWLLMAWAAGMRWWQLAAIALLAIPVAYIGWNYVLHSYQRTRLLVFLDPQGYDPGLKGDAWNIVQALGAIGSGGLTGRGWTHGLITQGGYLPVQYSDFIFAVSGEELGFVGSAVLLVFQGILMWQALTVARVARDTFGRLIAVGVMAMLLCHVLVNVGMNMSIMPITGIPLPFVSYGGSFTLTTFAAIGLLESVALRRRKLTFA
jgi:rod shape determining protein RodA